MLVTKTLKILNYKLKTKNNLNSFIIIFLEKYDFKIINILQFLNTFLKN